MSKTKSTAKLVITSVILSLIVLAIFTLVFLKYIVPVYNITEKQVYDVLVKLFPILVGLALISMKMFLKFMYQKFHLIIIKSAEKHF